MLGYEKELDWFGIELDVAEFFMYSDELPVSFIQQIAEKYQVSKSIVQHAVSEFQYETRRIEECEAKGHKFVDTSYGGPEHGEISAYCKKCGYSFKHNLY